MSKRVRTSLFLLLGLLFLLGAPALILYSQGYRFDWHSQWFSQVGAFYFSVTPARADVLIDGQLIGKTAHILGATLTKNFSPGFYHVRIQKEGYHPWEKQLPVSPKQVTEAKHVVLFPIDLTFPVVAENVLALWPAPTTSEVLVQKTSSSTTKTRWNLTLWNPRQNSEYLLYEPTLPGEEIVDVRWESDSRSFVFQTISQGQSRAFAQRIDRNLLSQTTDVQESLRVAAQLRGPYILAPRIQQAVAFLEYADAFIWIDQNGILWQQKNASQAVQLNQRPLLLRKEISYAIYAIKNEFFIQEAQTLYLLNRQTQAFEEFFTPFREMVLSPDGRKLALSSGRELWLHYFEEDRDQPPRAKGERIFLTRFSEDIKNLAWLTSHYLLFTRGTAILASEIDTRDRLNVVELAAFPDPTLIWQGNEKTLLVHTNEQIHASKNLLP